jgi:mRNA-degrading endonuclease toxin of MazEF toxin-antitoxin module
MKRVKRGVIIDVNLDPAQGAVKGKIRPCVIVTKVKFVLVSLLPMIFIMKESLLSR